jgi:glutamate---methylamine ligase
MTIDLTSSAQERGIKYFLISYTDLFGVQRAKPALPVLRHGWI